MQGPDQQVLRPERCDHRRRLIVQKQQAAGDAEEEDAMTNPVVALVGAEYEENLSLRYLSSTLAGAGFATEIVAFNDDDARPEVVRQVLACDPLVVGVSVPFQVRARELLAVTGDLRRAGY